MTHLADERQSLLDQGGCPGEVSLRDEAEGIAVLTKVATIQEKRLPESE
jgi:hypothetical protein